MYIFHGRTTNNNSFWYENNDMVFVVEENTSEDKCLRLLSLLGFMITYLVGRYLMIAPVAIMVNLHVIMSMISFAVVVVVIFLVFNLMILFFNVKNI